MRNKTNKLKIFVMVIVAYFLISTLLSLFNKTEENISNTNNYIENHNVTYDSETSDENVDNEIINGVRKKYTTIKGNGEDDVTVMVYMIGTDLESQYGMATKDVYELLNGKTYDNINIILQTGGCKDWNNSVFSDKVVERWAINAQYFSRLKDAGRVSMTSPETLSDFIKYASDNFPANRNILILWDHGGGSETGYGYDENYPNSGSLSPSLIAKALKQANVKFDFIGFDACLMANYETALAIEPYADYLIGSEETEPGGGWYYTNWIQMLDKDTSVPTLSVAKTIIDDYISYTNKTDRGAELTQSVIDLGELVYTTKEPFTTFSKAIVDKLDSADYQSIAIARSNTKEFSKESQLDQVDFIDLANKFNVDGSANLVSALKTAIKYNKTSNINNSYGLSIFFPYSSLAKVNSIISIYDDIEMNENYAKVVKSFATYASSGQIVTQNSGSSSTSLFDILYNDNYYYDDSYYDNNYYDDLYNSYNYQGNGYGYQDSFGYGYDSWMEDVAIDLVSSFFRNGNIVKPSRLKIQKKNNQRVISLSDEEWNLIDSITLNTFIDDGNGYLDLGKDNVFDWNEYGDLIVDYDGTWLTINNHIVSYQFVSDTYINENNYKIVGYVPAYLNEQKVNLIINFTNDNPDGIVLGAQALYEDSDIIQKGLIEIKDGDEIKFICNYYSYDGKLIDEYQINDSLIVNGDLNLYNVYLDNNYVYAYCLKDIYGNNLWSPKTMVNK